MLCAGVSWPPRNFNRCGRSGFAGAAHVRIILPGLTADWTIVLSRAPLGRAADGGTGILLTERGLRKMFSTALENVERETESIGITSTGRNRLRR